MKTRTAGCLLGAMLAAGVLDAAAQEYIPIVHPVFEKHIIVKDYSGSCSITDTTTTNTSSNLTEPIVFSCPNSGLFNGSVTLQFPATVPEGRTTGNFDGLIHLSAGISGNWTITNQSGADRVTTEALLAFGCPGMKTTNGPPLPNGTYAVSASASCDRTNLTYLGVDGIDYIFQTQSDLDARYINQSGSVFNSVHVQVRSRYRAPGGPWMYVNTNQPFNFVVIPPNSTGTAVTQQLVNIGNFGTADLNFTVSSPASWLTFEATSGTLTKAGGTLSGTNFYARINTNGLAPGTYNTTMQISANTPNSPKIIPVTLKVATDTMAIVSVGPPGVQPAQSVRFNVGVQAKIETTPIATLYLYLYTDQNTNWLTYTLESFYAQPETFQSNVFLPYPANPQVNLPTVVTNLRFVAILSDTFTGRLMTSNVFNYPVQTAIGIALDKKTLEFTVNNSNPPPQLVQLKNTGSSNLNFTITATNAGGAVAWLAVLPVGGILAPQQATNLSVTVIASKLPANPTNSAEISVSGNAANSPQSVLVQANQKPARLVGLEANQSVQDWNNSILLVSNKQTLVRAHIQSISTNEARVSGVLRGFRNGMELPNSPVRPINTGGFIIATTNAALVRASPNFSLNFFLPPTWTTGMVDVQIDGPGIACGEAAGLSNDCMAQLTFQSVAVPRVNFVRVKWFQTNGTAVLATEEQAQELANRLFAIYPIAALNWFSTELAYTNPGPPVLETLLPIVNYQRFLNGCRDGCERLYYGFLNGSLGGGLGYVPGKASVGWMPPPEDGYGRNRHAHELAHNLNRQHAVRAALGVTNNEVHGYCNEVASVGSPDFPFFEVVDGQTVPTLGPMTAGEDRRVYGFDNHARNIVDPLVTHELLGYCGSSRWVSSFTYTNIRDRINLIFGGGVAGPPGGGAPDSYLVARGTINLANDQTAFAPCGNLTTRESPELPPSGPYIMRALAANGAILNEISFSPDRMEPDFPEPLTTKATFIIPVPSNPAIRSIAILHGPQVIGTRTASPNPPQVHVVSPNGGQSILGNPVEFQWTASDPDGDPLTYVVQYSDDNGTNWTTLAVDWPHLSYTPDYSSLRKSSQGRIRVIASDGFNTASDESDQPFTVANHTPDIFIQTPEDQQLLIGEQQTILQASVHDVEDGDVPDQNIQWESSVDGVLGSGRLLSFPVTALSEGTHIITATAHDSSNSSGASQVSVTVLHTTPASLADLEVSQTSQNTSGGLVFTITVKNLGPTAATGLRVTDELPAGAAVLSATSTLGTCTVANGQLVCSVAQLAVGQTVVVTLQLSASPGAYLNLADVKAIELDPNLANNLVTINASFVEQPPQLLIERAGNLITISWPATTPTNYVLRSSATLSSGPWQSVSETPVIVGGSFQVVHGLTNSGRYYRLERP